jgi:hypothetical protein
MAVVVVLSAMSATSAVESTVVHASAVKLCPMLQATISKHCRTACMQVKHRHTVKLVHC